MKKIKKIFVVLMSLAFVSSIVSSFIIVSAEEVEKVQENSHTIVEEYNTNKIESRIAGLIGWIHGQNNKVEINITPVRNPNNNRIQMAFKNVGNLTGEINGSVLLYHMSGIGTLPIPIGSGRVKEVKIGDKVVTGVKARSTLGLNSADFTVTQSGSNIVFSTKGWGHGVGMSQYGANGMAKAGYSYKQILLHYYTGVTISKI